MPSAGMHHRTSATTPARTRHEPAGERGPRLTSPPRRARPRAAQLLARRAGAAARRRPPPDPHGRGGPAAVPRSMPLLGRGRAGTHVHTGAQAQRHVDRARPPTPGSCRPFPPGVPVRHLRGREAPALKTTGAAVLAQAIQRPAWDFRSSLHRWQPCWRGGCGHPRPVSPPVSPGPPRGVVRLSVPGRVGLSEVRQRGGRMAAGKAGCRCTDGGGRNIENAEQEVLHRNPSALVDWLWSTCAPRL